MFKISHISRYSVWTIGFNTSFAIIPSSLLPRTTAHCFSLNSKCYFFQVKDDGLAIVTSRLDTTDLTVRISTQVGSMVSFRQSTSPCSFSPCELWSIGSDHRVSYSTQQHCTQCELIRGVVCQRCLGFQEALQAGGVL